MTTIFVLNLRHRGAIYFWKQKKTGNVYWYNYINELNAKFYLDIYICITYKFVIRHLVAVNWNKIYKKKFYWPANIWIWILLNISKLKKATKIRRLIIAIIDTISFNQSSIQWNCSYRYRLIWSDCIHWFYFTDRLNWSDYIN